MRRLARAADRARPSLSAALAMGLARKSPRSEKAYEIERCATNSASRDASRSPVVRAVNATSARKRSLVTINASLARACASRKRSSPAGAYVSVAAGHAARICAGAKAGRDA